MRYNIGCQDSDKKAEQASYDAGLGRSGVGGNAFPPEPGVFYFPTRNGLPTGWPRLWALNRGEGNANDYAWHDLNFENLVRPQELAALRSELIQKLGSCNCSYHGSDSVVKTSLDVDYHPNKGPDTGPGRGMKLQAEYHGQIARQWQSASKQVRLWISRNSKDATEWWPVVL